MLAFLVFVLAVLVVGGVLFVVGSLLLGRGETQPPADPRRSQVALPDDRAVTAADVGALQITVTARGYRMTEVDWLLERLALALEDRDTEIAGLRAELVARAEQDMPTDPGAQPIEGGVHPDA